VPSASHNLLSINKLLTDNQCHLILTPTSSVVKDSITGKVLFQGPTDRALYPLFLHVNHRPSSSALFSSPVPSSTWHLRLGHPSTSTLHHILSTAQLPASKTGKNSSCFCRHCPLGKSSKLPFFPSQCNSTAPLQLIHSDVWGPSPVPSISGFKYYVIFIDDWSRYTWLFPLKSKSDVPSIFSHFKALVEN
jgi:hypothetical protein